MSATLQECQELCRLEGKELEQLWHKAAYLRDQHWGKVLTYSPKVFLPVTNLCRDRCSYCTFRRSPNDPKAKTMSLDEIAQICSKARQLGCIEALMCLGDRPETAYPSYGNFLRHYGVTTTAAYVQKACQVALECGLLPHTNAGLLTKEEMASLRPLNVSLGLMLENISPRLREKGQAHAAAPDKDPQKRLRMLQEAGELKIPFTTGVLVGIGETDRELVESLWAIHQMQQEFGHIQEVIIQGFRRKADTPMAGRENADDRHLAKVIAIARLMMPQMSVQAPPNLSPTAHQLLIEAGINDWGGISPLTLDFINPEAPWPAIDSLRQTCREMGFQLQARLPIYPSFYRSRSDFLDQRLRQPVERHHHNLTEQVATPRDMQGSRQPARN